MPCPRRSLQLPSAHLGALLVDPKRNVVLMDGYNGGPEAVAGCAVGRNASGTR